uniref:Metaxin glutathione S-transferase domain-containing protein n=1 Tax=Trichuris muris TaxID=70415 RepID=A0A5S6QDQ7_TRIMR
MSQLSLQVWPSEFLLPSIDARCLQYMACAKFCAVPVRVEPSVSPWSTSRGNYPEIRGVSSGRTNYNFREFVRLLQSQNGNPVLDGDMDEFTSEIETLRALTSMHIYPAYLYTMWLNKYNLNAIIDRWYCEKLGIVYGYYFVGKMRRQAQKVLVQRYGYHADMTQLENKAIDFARYGLKLLSKRLANDKYFFGSRPSSLDAFVFGCLAPLIYIPLPDNRLQVFLRSECQNLVQFVSSIINTYMPLSREEVRIHQERMAQWEVYREEYRRERQGASSGGLVRSVYPLWEKIVFGVVAASLSLAFAIGCGVIQIQLAPIRSNGRKKEGN